MSPALTFSPFKPPHVSDPICPPSPFLTKLMINEAQSLLPQGQGRHVPASPPLPHPCPFLSAGPSCCVSPCSVPCLPTRHPPAPGEPWGRSSPPCTCSSPSTFKRETALYTRFGRCSDPQVAEGSQALRVHLRPPGRAEASEAHAERGPASTALLLAGWLHCHPASPGHGGPEPALGQELPRECPALTSPWEGVGAVRPKSQAGDMRGRLRSWFPDSQTLRDPLFGCRTWEQRLAPPF